MSAVHILGVPQSTMVRVVRIVAEELNVSYNLAPAPPHSPEVLAIHPLGKIPVLRHGDVTLFESRAIITYLDRAFGGEPLIPSDPLRAATIEQWVSLAISAFDPVLIREYLFAHIFSGASDGAPDRARIEAVLPKVKKQLEVLNNAVRDGFIVGDSFTLADAYVAPMLDYLRTLPESGSIIAEARNLPAYIDRLESRPSVRATAPPTS